MNIYGKDIKRWLDDPKRIPGTNSKNVAYLRAYKQVLQEFGRVRVLLYLLIVRLKVDDVRAMLISSGKQQRLIRHICKDLKAYEVTQEWERCFKTTLTSMHRRCEHIFCICKENLKLTEYHPYFAAVGYEKLIDFTNNYIGMEDADQEKMVGELLAEIEAYNTEHADEIAAHMEAVRPEIEARDAWREKIVAEAKARKQAARTARKEEREELKQMEKYRKEDERRKRKINRELNRAVGKEIF